MKEVAAEEATIYGANKKVVMYQEDWWNEGMDEQPTIDSSTA